MMREITTHRVNDDEPIRIFSAGPLNPAGAQNNYVAVIVDGEDITQELGTIKFQNGHPDEHGRNGVTLETLLAVCHDRLTCFQAGPFPCEQNAEAIQHIERALESLKDRTREREKESKKARKAESENG
jgi:hypothetical protein